MFTSDRPPILALSGGLRNTHSISEERDCLRTKTSHSSRGLTARRTVAGRMGGEAAGIRGQRTPSRGGLPGKEMRWEEQPGRDPRRAATLQSAQGPREVAALAAAAPPGHANQAKADGPEAPSARRACLRHHETQPCRGRPLGNIFTPTFHFQFRSRFLRRRQAALVSQVTRSAQI